MRKILILLILVLVSNLTFGQTKYQKDFNEFWNDVNENYAYLEQQGIDWDKVKKIYSPKIKEVSNRTEFIEFLENVLNELYNGHNHLKTNLKSSNRLIPTGLDLFVEKINGKYIITDLRKGYGAKLSGLELGMEIIKFNGKSIDPQLKKFLPKFTSDYNPQMIQYAISKLFAGTHYNSRKITVKQNGEKKDFYPDKFKTKTSNKLLEYKKINETGYIKINNSLGDNDLISRFDKALDSLMDTKKLIIDLTETPSGGNTTVARAIMGRFINKKMPYQQHEFDENKFDTKRYWVEYVIPRKPIYSGKVYLLVGHWTGSMGEGIAIGFDVMERATIIGTEMAGLLGEMETFELTETKIRFAIPFARLYHINGTPREDFIPEILIENTEQTYIKMNKIIE